MKAERAMKRRAAFAHLSLIALGAPLLMACGPSVYALPAPTSCLRDAGPTGGGGESPLEAAALDVDITPPIGLSLFGHGLEGRIASGLITHLGCRGLVFRKASSSFAWVTCDLQSVSLALYRRVAELVRAETDLGADRLFLSATHTHAGPAHFTEGRAYISAIGGSREPSYDQQVVDFIARRISGGIIAATHRLEPVEIRSLPPPPPHPSSARDRVACVEGLSRNRAMPAFLRNPQGEHDSPCVDLSHPLDPAHESVNREVTLLRVDRPLGAGTLGLMAVFAVHPTAISNLNDRYHGDLFAFAIRYCQDTLEARQQRGAVCAIANGAEGDVSPDWAYQGELEARRLGGRLGAYIIRAFDNLRDQAPDPPLLASRYRELVLPSAKVELEAPPRGAAGCGALTPYAEIGTPVGGGAADGPTRLRIFEQLNQGIVLPGREDVCSRPRAAVLGVMPTNLDDSLAGYYFPVRVPIAWFRVGLQAFVTVPGEPTTMTGYQLERAATSCGSAPAEVAGVRSTRTVGLTNGYMSYIATAAEYEAQYYEGAETLYGKRTADFFSAEVRRLVCDAAPPAAAPARCDARPASHASKPGSADPPYEAVTASDRNPNIPPLGVTPTQPAPGEVGALYISPDPVRSRWPKDLPVDKACWSLPGQRAPLVDARSLVAPPPNAVKPIWSCAGRAPSLEVSWKDTPSLPLCGSSIVTLLASRRRDRPFYVAHADVDAPECILISNAERPEGEPRAAGRALENAYHGQFRSLRDGSGPPIDDEHAFVQIWFDDDDDRWHARFRAPEYIGWAREARFFRFAIKSSSGEVWATPPVEWSPYHPPCPMPDETETRCVTRPER